MSNNPLLLPIFRLLPSTGLRYEPIRPIGTAVSPALRWASFSRFTRPSNQTPTRRRDTNQISS